MKENSANRILVVEDDPTVRGYLATVLTDDGFSITTRSSGKAAKALLKKESFDLVLTDLIMPEFSGLDLLKFIRKNKINSEVIILTAFSDMDSVLGALREGADDFLIKPCDRLVLNKAITRAIKKVNLEREKKKSDEKYHKLFQSTTDMVYLLDSKGIVTEMNSRGLEIFGRTRGQIIGKHFKRLFNKDDFPEAVEAFEKTMKDGTAQLVARIRPKDNSLWYFEFTYSPLYSEGSIQGVYCIAHDVTQLKQLQNQLEQYSRNLEKIVEEKTTELKASEERLRALTATARDGFITVNSAGNVTFANPAAGRILGCSPESIISEPIESIIPSEIQDSRNSPLKPFLEQNKQIPEGVTVEVRVRKRSGEDFSAEASISCFTIQDEVYVTILLRDISSRAEVLNRSLQRQKMESIGRLAGGIAHNLNNNLCGLLGYASFLKTTVDKGTEMYRYLDTMEDSCVKAATLVRQIVEFAEGGKYHVEICDPKELVYETVDFIRKSFPSNISIDEKIDSSVKNIVCDIGQIRQVLLNLSINAREAMQKGGDLTFRVSNVKAGGKLLKKHPDLKSAEYVAVTVKDTGKGIDPKIMEQMFEPFYSTKGFGYGMGLSSSLGIIKRHGGIIDVESEVGSGTVFTAYIPVTNKKLPKEIAVAPARLYSGTETILVVDDEKVFVDLARDVLQRSGFTVLAVETGEEGIRAFKKHKDDIDLVLLDLMLPDMGGGEVLQAISDINPSTKFAITSGHRLQDMADELRDRVDGAFLKKPCTAEMMTEIVRMALDRRS